MNNRMKWFQIFCALLLTGTLVFASVGKVSAYEVDNDGKVTTNEVIEDDLILAGDRVVMNGTVVGTLIATGANVTINGKVDGDVFAFGQNVTIGQGAQIDGNLFTGAQVVTVAGKVMGSFFSGTMSTILESTASIDRNLYFGGYSLSIAEQAQVKKDLAAGGYQVIQAGTVGRDVKADVGAYQLLGEIGRNFNVVVSEPGQSPSNDPSTSFFPQSNMPETLGTGLTIASTAKIGGDLSYTSQVPQASAIQAIPGGTTVYKTPVPDANQNQEDQTSLRYRTKKFFEEGFGKTIVNMVRNFISLFIVGVLALWLIPGSVKAVDETIRSKPLPSIGYGIVVYLVGGAALAVAVLVIIAVALLIGLISFGGLGSITFWSGSAVWLSALTAFTFLCMFAGKVVLVTSAGKWIIQKLNNGKAVNSFLALFLGSIFYVIVRAIPGFGFLVAIALSLAGLGAIWMVLRRSNFLRPAPAVVEAK
jgi:hypothetical protein